LIVELEDAIRDYSQRVVDDGQESSLECAFELCGLPDASQLSALLVSKHTEVIDNLFRIGERAGVGSPPFVFV
jgi:hypothetical protein